MDYETKGGLAHIFRVIERDWVPLPPLAEVTPKWYEDALNIVAFDLSKFGCKIIAKVPVVSDMMPVSATGPTDQGQVVGMIVAEATSLERRIGDTAIVRVDDDGVLRLSRFGPGESDGPSIA